MKDQIIDTTENLSCFIDIICARGNLSTALLQYKSFKVDITGRRRRSHGVTRTRVRQGT